MLADQNKNLSENYVENETSQTIVEYKKSLQAKIKAMEDKYQKLEERGQFEKAETLYSKIGDIFDEVRALNMMLAKKQRDEKEPSSQQALLEIKGTGLATLDKKLTEFLQNSFNGCYYWFPSANKIYEMLETLRKTSEEPNLDQIIEEKGGQDNFVLLTVELMLQLKKENFTLFVDNIRLQYGTSNEPQNPAIFFSPVCESRTQSVSAIKAVQNIVAEDQSYLTKENINDTEDVILYEDEENEASFVEIESDEADHELFYRTLMSVEASELNAVREENSFETCKSVVEELENVTEVDDNHVTVRKQNPFMRSDENQLEKLPLELPECESFLDLELSEKNGVYDSGMMTVSHKIWKKLHQDFGQPNSGVTVYGLSRIAEKEVVDLEGLPEEFSKTQYVNSLPILVTLDYEDDKEIIVLDG